MIAADCLLSSHSSAELHPTQPERGRLSAHAYLGANNSAVRHGNRATIFRAIRALGPLARVELARRTRLNPATVTNIVDELIAAGLVSETGRGSSRVGRKPILLEVVPSARLTLGIDIARAAMTGAIVDLGGQIVERIDQPAGPWLTSDIVLESVADMIGRLLAHLSPDEQSAVVGIGIGVPGPLSGPSEPGLETPSFRAWDGMALQSSVAARFQLPTRVDNNGNTSALGELWFGAGQGVDNFILLNVGTVVGAGLVLDGYLYRGDHGLAGELGHISVNADGPQCACGNRGCLEMYISAPRVLAAVRAALASGEPSVVRSTLEAGGELTITTLVGAVHHGDPLATRVLADVARYLAAGIVSIAHAFDPHLILIGRDLAIAGDVLLDTVRAEVQRRVLPPLRQRVCIEVAAVLDAPVVGAATLAMRDFFQAPLANRSPESWSEAVTRGSVAPLQLLPG